MAFYYIIFLILSVLAYFSLNRKVNSVAFIISGVILFLIAAFRKENVDKDYIGYIEYYYAIVSTGWSIVEPTFILISKLVSSLTNNILFVFIIYAFFGVILKFIAINRLTDFKMFSVIIYFCGYFLLFEMTQIRAGVAAGFLLLSLKPIRDRKLILFVLIALLAVLFHYSAIIILPLYFLNARTINRKFYALLIPTAYLFYFLNINVFTIFDMLPIPLVQSKITSYTTYALQDDFINLFNYIHLFRCLVAYFFLLKYRIVIANNQYGLIIIKIYFFALFIFVAFASVPGISSRISEFLLIVEIILIPFLIYVFKQRVIGLSLVILIGLGFISFALFYSHLLNPYF